MADGEAHDGDFEAPGLFEKTHVGRAEKEREWSGKTERADGARCRRVRGRMGTRRERNGPRATEQQLQRSAEGVDRSTVEGGEMSARAVGLLVGLIIGRVRRYWFVSAFSLFVRDGIRCDGAATRGGCEPQSWAGYGLTVRRAKYCA